jgi:phage terminase large subunit-like protein
VRLEHLRDGDEVLAFMCAALVHGPGEWEGQRWRPLEWQADFVRELYARGTDGNRQIDRALLLTPKGAGKTELAGGLSVIEMVIRPSAEVILAASTWDQAALLKGSADGACAHLNSPLAAMVEVTDAEIRLRGTTSRIVRVASEARSNDGARPTCVIRDEVHEWNTPNREQNYQVLGAGLAKRRGVAIDISTVGADKDSLLGRLVEYAGQVQAGEIDDPRFLYVYHGAEGQLDGLDLYDDNDLEMAITIANPSARGDRPFVDPSEVRRRYREMPPGRAKRYFLNLWGEGGDEQWLPEGRWRVLADPDRVIPVGTTVFAGFDGSDRSDSTALVAVAVEDSNLPHVIVLGVWERPPNAPDGWNVPRDEVEAAVTAMFDRYDVRAFRCDPFLWREEVRAWQDRFGAKTVEDFPTNKHELWGQSCELTYAAIAGGHLTHDGDERLARHLKHAIPRTSPNHKWVTFSKPHRDSLKKVDAAVALTLAVHARHDWTPGLVPLFGFT